MFQQYATTVSKFQLSKLEELPSEERVNLRLDEIGFQLARTSQMTRALRPLFQDFLDLLPLTAQGKQDRIGVDYAKIRALIPVMRKTAEIHDQAFGQEDMKCVPLIDDASRTLDEIDQHVPHLTSATASAMSSYLDGIRQKVSHALQYFEKIIERVGACEQQLIPKLKASQGGQQQISYQVAQCLIALENLAIELVFLSSNSKIKGSSHAGLLQDLDKWIKHIGQVSEAILKTPREDYRVVAKQAATFSGQMSQFAQFLGTIQPVIPEDPDFPRSAAVLTTAMQALNQIESKAVVKDVSEIVKSVASSLLNNKPLEKLLKIGQDLLDGVREKVVNMDNRILAAYGTLTAMVQVCSYDAEVTALTLVSIVRFIARIFPDGLVAEELIVSLIKKITLITKTIFKEGRKVVSAIHSIVDTNLEFFNDQLLNEVNYFLTAARNHEDFDTESKEFLVEQQQFFDAICALPSPLTKLMGSCEDQETKNQLAMNIDTLQGIGNRYAKWLNQFYLTAFTLMVSRSEHIYNAISFPVSLLVGLGHKEGVDKVMHVVSSMQTTLQATPQIMLGDLSDTISLLGCLSELSKNINEFVTTSNKCSKLPIMALFKQATVCLEKIVVPVPTFVMGLPSVNKFGDMNAFVTGLIALFSRALLLLQESKTMVERADPTAAFYFSVTFQFLLTCNSVIHAQKSVQLMSLMGPLRSQIDVVWPIIMQIATGQSRLEANYLSSIAASFIKAINDMLNTILNLPQPKLAYEIPDDVQEIKRFDSMAASLHSTPLKQFAQYVVRTLKKSSAADVRSALNQWFDATQVAILEPLKAAVPILNAIPPLMTAATIDRSHFIQGFATLSVSLAAFENGYGKTVSMILNGPDGLHKAFVSAVLEFLESSRNSQTQLMKIYGFVAEIGALTPISKLKQKEMDSYLTESLKEVVIQLNILRQKGREAQLKDTMQTVNALKVVEGFFLVSPPADDLGVGELVNTIMAGKCKKDTIDNAVKTFSDKLVALIPNQFAALDRIRDTDTVCDFVYDKAEEFRDDMNKIVAFAKTHDGTDEQICKPINSMLLNASDAAVLTIHSLMLAGLVFTPISATFVSCFSEICINFPQFVETALQINRKKTEDLSPALRSIYRKMNRQFDAFINIVENPQKPTGEVSEFESSKHQMYAALSTVAVQIARLNALAATSLVPEMYRKKRHSIEESLNESLAQLSNSVATVRSKAVGNSSNEIGTLFTELESSAKDLCKASRNLVFGTALPPQPLLGPCQTVCQITLKMAVLGPSLTDRIILEPDPAAAGRVPDDCIMPTLPKNAPSPGEALQDMTLAKRHVDDSTTQFKQVNDQPLAGSGELLRVTEALKLAVNDFAEKALTMAVATVDPRYQVEQQTALHTFLNQMNNVLAAMKNRLMRTPSFAQEMEDALAAFHSSLERCVELGEVASKIEVQTENDENMDEVTRELNATAKSIEKLSARLKEYQEQMKAEMEEIEIPQDEEVQIPDIQAAAGTLPAFLVASATPILAATSEILKRAQEITADLVKKFGRIDNERGLIRSAQDLSEAAELLLICAEILVTGQEVDAEFKVIAAARIIKASVASLVAQVLVKGGDSEGIMNKHVRTVSRISDAIIQRAEAIVEEKLAEEEAKKPQKKVNNPMIMRLNMQQTVNQQRKQLQEEEKNLYQFRRRA